MHTLCFPSPCHHSLSAPPELMHSISSSLIGGRRKRAGSSAGSSAGPFAPTLEVGGARAGEAAAGAAAAGGAAAGGAVGMPGGGIAERNRMRDGLPLG